MPRQANDKVKLSVLIPESLRRELRTEAAMTGASIQEIVNAMISRRYAKRPATAQASARA